jgi:hypothetical protein
MSDVRRPIDRERLVPFAYVSDTHNYDGYALLFPLTDLRSEAHRLAVDVVTRTLHHMTRSL